MSNKVTREINNLDKSQLLIVAKKLGINKLSRKNKPELKREIIENIKNRTKNKNTQLLKVRNTGPRSQPTSAFENINFIPVVNRQSDRHHKMSVKKDRINQPNYVNNTNGINVDKALYPKVNRLIAIGDVHGDLNATIKALKLANVISLSIPNNSMDINKINWTGGNTVVVQLGDQIDRVRPSNLINNICSDDDPDLYQDEGSDLKIISLFNKLHQQAISQGGACLSILGNHELMNVEGDFRYVSPREFREFGNFFKANKSLKNTNVPYGFRERKEAFAPGGLIAKKLAETRYSTVQVGSWVFVHGGLTKYIAERYTLEDLNNCVKKWLMGEECDLVERGINDIYHNEDDSVSPFWTRIFSDLEEFNDPGNGYEAEFYSTIQALNKKNCRNNQTKIRGMILGHSPQFMYGKGINSACNDCIWRVDIGMSRAFGEVAKCNPDYNNRKVQVLLIENDNKFTILKEK
jgi:hypothetical protein